MFTATKLPTRGKSITQYPEAQRSGYPFGETRSGNIGTDRRFTGQREENGLGSLYDYNARFYSPVLGRFLSADTIVPDPSNPQSLNRFSYALNNPVKYTDPSGHMVDDDADGIGLGGIFQAYRYWQDRPDDLRMALKAFFEAHPDYDLSFSENGPDGFKSGLREGDWSDAVFSQMWVGLERGGGEEASKYLPVVAAAGVMAEGNGPNTDGLSGLLGTSGTTGNVVPKYNREAFGDWQPGTQRAVLEQDGFECVYCGSTDDLTVDHVKSANQTWDEGAYAWTPEERNAWFNDKSNLVTACRTCNASKGAMDPFDWFISLFTGAKGRGRQ